MQFIIMLVVLKIAMTVLFFTLGAWLIAEFFPILADKAIAVSSGTVMSPVGDFIAQALNFIAKYARMFVELVFGWLRAFGINVSSGDVRDTVNSAASGV